MPKIRGIKPETWTDENFVELSAYARLLFIGLWNYACDNGHVEDKSKQIKMRILPTDDVNCAELLREIETHQLIERAGGWITIPNLTHHQKPHKSWWMTCDKPGCVLPEGTSHAPNNRGTTVAKQLRNSVATADVDVDVDVDGELKLIETLSRKTSAKDAEGFDAFWDAYEKKIGRKTASLRFKSALKKPGVTAELLTRAAVDYIAWQKSEGKFPDYTKNASSWLNGEHWNDERVAKSTKPPISKAEERMRANLAVVEQLRAEEQRTQLRAIEGNA